MSDIWVLSEQSSRKQNISDAAFHGYFTSEAEAQDKIDSMYWVVFNKPVCISNGVIDKPLVLSTPQRIPVSEHHNHPLYSQYVHNEPKDKLLSIMSYMALPGKEVEILQFICEHTSIPCEQNPYGKGYNPSALPSSETLWMMVKIAEILTEENFWRFADYAHNTANTQFNWSFPYYVAPKKKTNPLNLDYASYVKTERATILASALVNYEDNLFTQYKDNTWGLEKPREPRRGIHIIDLLVELLTGENYTRLKEDYEKATQ